MKDLFAWFLYDFNLMAGLTGLFCPCVLFGRNVERLKEDTPWTGPCICHAICIEGGISLAIATAAATSIFPAIEPGTVCLIIEGLLFTWWMCGIHTGQVRQSLQKKYHLKVHVLKIFFIRTNGQHQIWNVVYQTSLIPSNETYSLACVRLVM